MLTVKERIKKNSNNRVTSIFIIILARNYVKQVVRFVILCL